MLIMYTLKKTMKISSLLQTLCLLFTIILLLLGSQTNMTVKANREVTSKNPEQMTFSEKNLTMKVNRAKSAPAYKAKKSKPILLLKKASFTASAGGGDILFIEPKTKITKLQWSSNNKRVATVSATGVIKTIAPGRTKIRVSSKKDHDVTASFYLYVPYQRPTGIKISKVSTSSPEEHIGKLKVSWRRDKTVKQYKIFRSNVKNGQYQLIGTSFGNSYIDDTAQFKKTFYYKVVAGNSHQKCDSKKSRYAKGMASQ